MRKMLLLACLLLTCSIVTLPGEAAAHECPAGTRIDFYTPVATSVTTGDDDGGYLHVCI